MSDGYEVGDRQLSGFKDFFQAVGETRVIAGRDLLASTGFEFMKENASRSRSFDSGTTRMPRMPTTT